MSLPVILKYWTAIHLRRRGNFRYKIIPPKLKTYCRHAKFIHNFRFLSKNKKPLNQLKQNLEDNDKNRC